MGEERWTIRDLVENLNDHIFGTLRASLLADEPVTLATVLEVTGSDAADAATAVTGVSPGASLLVRRVGPPLGSLGDSGLDASVTRDALGHLDSATTAVRHYGPHGEVRRQDVAVFIEAFAPPPKMLIFGAVDFAAALARIAKVLGYRVTVCDARPVFATASRFPMADEVVVDWPDRHLAGVGSALGPRDAVCILTHDPKFDVPAIEAALRTAVGYIGAMGSRRTTDDRERRLRDSGVDDARIARVMAPIGLDIGARTPEETAVSICAEIISLRSGRATNASLSRTDGPIHREARPTGVATTDRPSEVGPPS